MPGKRQRGPYTHQRPPPPTKLIPTPTRLSSLPLLTNLPTCTQPGATGSMLSKLRKRRGIGRSGRGEMWVTAGMRSSSHRRTSPTGRSWRSRMPWRMRRRSKGLGEWAAEEENEEHGRRSTLGPRPRRPCIRRRNQSRPLARDDGAANNDGHQKAKRNWFYYGRKDP